MSAAGEGSEEHPGSPAVDHEADTVWNGPRSHPDELLDSGIDPLVGKQFTHYRVTESLGRGGMGAVYKAVDTRLDRTVALKVLLTEALEEESLRQRFQREARAVAALSHPNICKIFDVGEQDGLPFFVMELVDGVRLGERLSPEPLAIRDTGFIGAQIAEALAAAHAKGIVHRDIKPANILLAADDAVVVLDFGLAKIESGSFEEWNSLVEEAALTSLGQIFGTISYMSPEQARGQPVDAASDIFSLGVLLYRMATGSLPFQGNSHVEVLSGIITSGAISPSSLAPTVPPALDALILRMLAKYASTRPSASEVAKALRELASPRESGGSTLSATMGRTARPVVGRGKELEALLSEFDRVSSSRGQLLCLTGEPGIGKTTLVETFLAKAAERGSLGAVARGRCSERLVGAEALLPILEALEQLLRRGDHVAHQMRQLAPSWYGQIVSANSVGTAQEGTRQQFVPASQEQMTRELLSFFLELTRVRPAILFIDDLHWADASTTDLLGYLASRFDGLRLLILVTYRPTDIALSEHPFLKVRMELEAKALAREIPLSFLGYDDLGGYLDLEFPGHALPKEFLNLVHAKTEGNPLFMVDLVRYLRDRGALAEVNGRWELTAAVADIEEGLPASVRSLIQLKIDRLDDAHRKLLTAASVQGRQFDTAVLAAALEADPADIEEQLDQIESIHALVAIDEEDEFPDGTLTVRYSFVHALYQNAFYGSLRPTRRASHSASIAAALRSVYGKRSAEVAYQLAFLYENARDFAQATEFFATAAAQNMSMHAVREAAQLAERGLSHLARLPEEKRSAEQEFQLQSTLGPALMATRGFTVPEVGNALGRARELALHLGDAMARFRASRGLWQYFLVRGELPKALEISRELVEMADQDEGHTLVSEACRTFAECSMFTGDLSEARSAFERGIAHFDETSFFISESPLVLCLYYSAWTVWVLGEPDSARARVERAEAAAAGSEDPFSIAVAKFGTVMLNALLGDSRSVVSGAEEFFALARESGFGFLECVAQIPLGWGLIMQGDPERGLAEIQHGIESGEAAKALLIMPLFKALLADGLRHLGRHQEALSTLASAREISTRTGEVWMEAELKRLEGATLLAISPDRAGEAEQCFWEALALAQSQQARSWALRTAIDLAALLAARGEADSARDLLAPLVSSFTEGPPTGDLVRANELLAALS